MTVEQAVETFEEAVTRFQRFLADNGYAREIVWVEPQDVLVTGTRKTYVRVPAPLEREKRAREMYEAVMKLDCGLRMATFAESAEASYCYLWGWPADHEKDPQLWPRRGLFMSALQRDSRGRAEPVRNWLRWAWLSWRFRAKRKLKGLAFS